LRAAVEDALAFVGDEGRYIIEEGGCRVVLRIEPVTGTAQATLLGLAASRTAT